MYFLASGSQKISIVRILPWLHFAGALLVVVLNALFSAVHSTLGQEISAGESPGFAWIGANLTTGMGFGLVYLILVCWIQLRQLRQPDSKAKGLLSFLVCLQVAGIAANALMLFLRQTEFLPLVYTILLLSSLIQGVIAFRRPGLPDCDHPSLSLQQPAVNVSLFLALLFIVGAAISVLDPSWHRMAGQVLLDTNFESQLKSVFPPILSGITSVWLGIGMLVILIVISRLNYKTYVNQDVKGILFFLMFFSLVTVFTTFLCLTLFYAISWQINNLDLISTVWQLCLFFSVSGAMFFSRVFFKNYTAYPPTSTEQSGRYCFTDLRCGHSVSADMVFDGSTKSKNRLDVAFNSFPRCMGIHWICGVIR